MFGDHLLRDRLSDSRPARYFVHWTRRFVMHPARSPSTTPDEALRTSLDDLEREGVKDWQLDQARQAVTAWFTWRHRQEQEPRATSAPKVVPAADGPVDPVATLAALEETLRVRHYAFRTERTYRDWVRRFFDYLRSSGRVANGRPVVSKEAFSDFSSQLATRLTVGSSTQHQAFGALLFLFHE